MTDGQSKDRALNICRRVDGETVTVVCRSGSISVLEDIEGVALPWYTLAFLKSPPLEQGRLELNGKPLSNDSLVRVGFGARVNETCGIREYLAARGMEPAQVDRFVDECELSKHLYLTCGQLSASVARQVELLALLHSSAEVAVLDDPFQPFNGRWREYFAERVLLDAVARGRLFVVVNLSFLPQCWTTARNVERVDVGKLAKPQVVKLQSPDKVARAATEASALDAARLERQAHATLRIPVPENLKSAYREVKDWIFAPLARLSTGLRTYSAPVMLLGVALVLVLGAVIMVPNLGQLQASLAEMARDFNVSQSLVDLIQSPPSQDRHEKEAPPDGTGDAPQVKDEPATTQQELVQVAMSPEPQLDQSKEDDSDSVVGEDPLIEESAPFEGIPSLNSPVTGAPGEVVATLRHGGDPVVMTGSESVAPENLIEVEDLTAGVETWEQFVAILRREVMALPWASALSAQEDEAPIRSEDSDFSGNGSPEGAPPLEAVRQDIQSAPELPHSAVSSMDVEAIS